MVVQKKVGILASHIGRTFVVYCELGPDFFFYGHSIFFSVKVIDTQFLSLQGGGKLSFYCTVTSATNTTKAKQ